MDLPLSAVCVSDRPKESMPIPSSPSVVREEWTGSIPTLTSDVSKCSVTRGIMTISKERSCL